MNEVYRSTPGVIRGCGTRIEGGVYLESGLGMNGVPMEHFILDEPVSMKLDLKLGVQLWTDPNSGVTHIVDWVGSKHYPYPADIIEEGRRYGFSRRITPKIKWEDLDDRSRIILVHEKGRLKNVEAFATELDMLKKLHQNLCALYQRESMKLQSDMFPRMRDHVKAPHKHSCNAYHYTTAKATRADLIPADEDAVPVIWDQFKKKGLTPVQLEAEAARVLGDRSVGFPELGSRFKDVRYYREVGSTVYRVFPNWGLGRNLEPEFEPAAIAAIPITNISVMKSAGGEKHKATYAAIRARLSPLLNVEVNER